MEKKRINLAVSELVGALILLAIVTSVMALIFYQISTDKGPYKQTFVKLVGKIEGTDFILEHQGGDSLGANTSISLALGGKKYNYTVGSILEDTNHDGCWDLGERLVFPYTYDLSNLDKYNTIDVMTVDKNSNSIQFLGSVQLHPIVDLGITSVVSNSNPHKYDTFTVTLKLTCYGGDINGSANIKVQYLIPQGLQYVSSDTKNGSYDNTTGIWSIPKLIGDKTIFCNITLKVLSGGFREFTQFAIIMDGSNSISSPDWDVMRTGLFQALENESAFPRDKSVELTVIQFGTDMSDHYHGYWGAETEIPPTIINDEKDTPGYYHTNAVTIQTISQSRGNTPMACGIRLAADQLYNSQNYSSDKRQIILMVTDGLANCNWIPGTYKGERNDAQGKPTTEAADAYLNTTLHMNSGQDQFDVIAVGSGPDVAWLNNSIVWPQPGCIAPPFISGHGWVSKVTTWKEFSDRISEIFKLLLDSIPLKAEIISAFTSDPNSINNMNVQVITPST
jgi:Domain of unknown function DUF11/von Willebrand factor type A domain